MFFIWVKFHYDAKIQEAAIKRTIKRDHTKTTRNILDPEIGRLNIVKISLLSDTVY